MPVYDRLVAISLAIILLVACLSAAGCGKTRTGAAQVLAPEQVAPTIENAFKEAAPEAKEAAKDVVAAIQSQDEARALVQLQVLSAQPDLTPAQRTAAARSTMSVLARLQIAAANGSPVAEEMLKKYRATK